MAIYGHIWAIYGHIWSIYGHIWGIGLAAYQQQMVYFLMYASEAKEWRPGRLAGRAPLAHIKKQSILDHHSGMKWFFLYFLANFWV